MTSTIAHRGPDDSGHWLDPAAGVALGFRRLAIVDLSEQGHQPMHSASGRYTLVFNGEVYNFEALRRQLAGVQYRGHSDTEVILAAFEAWGIEAAVRRFVGMFAMAVWDAEQRRLTLLRDRLGIKPMFVQARDGVVLFGSELKALAAHPSFDRTLDRDALTSYLRYLYVPAPRTIYRRALKLPPGHLLTIEHPARPLPEPVAYWSLEAVARSGLAEPFAGSDTEAVVELERLLTDAVGLRMIADVPLGALLSGGVDSSTVVGLMQSLSSRPVKTFTIGFDSAAHNEAEHSRAVADHLGTDHTELHLTGQDALALVPRLSRMYDEPLADPSQLPTYLVSELARRQVTVALSGDGGDELFAGYNRYIDGAPLIERLGGVPLPLRRTLAGGLTSFSPATLERLRDRLAPMLPRATRTRLFGEKAHKLGELLRARSATAMYRSLRSAWQEPARFVPGGKEAAGDLERALDASSLAPLLERMLLADQQSYLPDDLLAKLDRASMAVSLEARVPILDHRVVEFSWRLPRRLKVQAGRGKWILRQVLYRHVPQHLVDREKVGFSVPIAAWLRGPLRPWAEELLSPDRLRHEGILAPESVRQAWSGFLSGAQSNALGLWALVVFQSWQEEWRATL